MVNVLVVAAVATYATVKPESAVWLNVFSPSLLFTVFALYFAPNQGRLLLVLSGFVFAALVLTPTVPEAEALTWILRGLATFLAVVAAVTVDWVTRRITRFIESRCSRPVQGPAPLP